MKNRIGEIRESNNYGLMEIIEYNGALDIKVKFKTGSVIKACYGAFKKGKVKDPLFPSIYGVCCVGIGKYKPTIDNKITIIYQTWQHMIQRCYDPYYINKQLTYQNATVCKSWLNFQNFAKWFIENYYKIPGEKVHIDKDIIKKGNKIYAPEFCSFVPQPINSLLIKRDNGRGKYPVGVCFDKSSNKYMTQISINGKQKNLGYFSTPKKAFKVYKIAKEKYIKAMTNKYKEVLDIMVYNSLMKYEVEITD